MIAAPDHLLSLEEWVALPEDNSRNFVPEQVLVAVEVVATGTRLVDTVIKPVEYAQAGIPCYWLIDPDDPVSLVAYRLVDGRYQEAPAVTGMFETSEPFSLRVDVAALARRA